MASDVERLNNGLFRLSALSNPNECEELAYELLAALPRSRLASIQRRIAPLLQFDILSALPTELSLHILAFLPYRSVLRCSLVCKRWKTLTDDQTLWKSFCHVRGWAWRAPASRNFGCANQNGRIREGSSPLQWDEDEDEGMGGSDQENEADLGMDSGFVSMSVGASGHLEASSSSTPLQNSTTFLPIRPRPLRQSTPAQSYSRGKFLSNTPAAVPTPDYKLLFRTHLLLQNRFMHSSYRLSLLQTRETPGRGHGNMIYCLQLYSYPSSGRQVLFTGSRDQTVREWDLETRQVVRIVEGVHTSSVLSICVHNDFLASAGSDRKVVLWDLEKGHPVKVIADHEDSVLCVRFDDKRLVTCSKDRTVRTYSFPDLEAEHVLREHRAAVNAVSIYKNLIVSGSGDRSVRLWDAETGHLLRTYDNHHNRGIASIDFKPPFVLSGSSDKHLRLLDMTTLRGWSIGSSSRSHHPHPHGMVNGANPGAGPNANVAAASSGDGPFALDPHLFTPFFDFGPDDIEDQEDELEPILSSCPSCALKSYSMAKPRSSNSAEAVLVCRDCGGNDVHALWGSSAQAYRTGRGSRGSPSGSNHGSGSAFGSRWLSGFFGFGSGSGSSGSALGSGRSSNRRAGQAPEPASEEHKDLVRSVALGERFVVSGSYDRTIKVWDRRTGALVADLTGGHAGRIFSIAFDHTKVVSCGEDQRICIWDFAHGIDTSFITLL